MREVLEDKSLPEEREYRLLPVLVRQLVAQLGHDHLAERVARFTNIKWTRETETPLWNCTIIMWCSLAALPQRSSPRPCGAAGTPWRRRGIGWATPPRIYSRRPAFSAYSSYLLTSFSIYRFFGFSFCIDFTFFHFLIGNWLFRQGCCTKASDEEWVTSRHIGFSLCRVKGCIHRMS